MTLLEFLDRIDGIMCGTSNAERALLENLYNEITPRWISVEEKLPDDGGFIGYPSVLVATEDGFVDVTYYDHINEHWGDYDGEITHWMPFPSLPVLSNSEKIGKDEKGGEE